MEGLAELLKAGTDVNVEQLKKELLRHQRPLAIQMQALVEMLQYQKSLIPQHIIEPLIESMKQYIITELDAIKG